MKHSSNESIDNYYNRFHELLDDLIKADELIPMKSAIHHFIFTLGLEFETIQINFRIGNLPSEWNSQDWPTLLILCCNDSNSIDSQKWTSVICLLILQPLLSLIVPLIIRRYWFPHPIMYCLEIEVEQQKHVGKCIYHLSKSHLTSECNVKKECDKILAKKKVSGTSASTSVSSGHLRNLKEEVFEDAIMDDSCDTLLVSDSNDTNENDLYYFARRNIIIFI
jgi:hypothetical protein